MDESEREKRGVSCRQAYGDANAGLRKRKTGSPYSARPADDNRAHEPAEDEQHCHYNRQRGETAVNELEMIQHDRHCVITQPSGNGRAGEETTSSNFLTAAPTGPSQFFRGHFAHVSTIFFHMEDLQDLAKWPKPARMAILSLRFTLLGLVASSLCLCSCNEQEQKQFTQEKVLLQSELQKIRQEADFYANKISSIGQPLYSAQVSADSQIKSADNANAELAQELTVLSSKSASLAAAIKQLRARGDAYTAKYLR